MKKLYSIKCLVESVIRPEPSEHKTFEEVIYLAYLEQPEVEAEALIRERVATSYENAVGETVTCQLARVLDVFEVVDSLPEEEVHLKEVYSRFLTFNRPVSVDEVVALYRLDQ